MQPCLGLFNRHVLIVGNIFGAFFCLKFANLHEKNERHASVVLIRLTTAFAEVCAHVAKDLGFLLDGLTNSYDGCLKRA